MLEEISSLVDRLEDLKQIFNAHDITQLAEINRTFNNKKIKNLIRGWKGTKHTEEYQNY